jgi:hypothetical protein
VKSFMWVVLIVDTKTFCFFTHVIVFSFALCFDVLILSNCHLDRSLHHLSSLASINLL